MAGKFGAGTPCTGGRVYLREVTSTATYPIEIIDGEVPRGVDIHATCEDAGGGCAETSGCFPVVKLRVQNASANPATVSFSKSGFATVTTILPSGEAVTYVTSDWFVSGTRYDTNADHGRIEVFEDSAPSTHVVDAYLACSACANFPSA